MSNLYLVPALPDSEFFRKFPRRQFRVRPATAADVEQVQAVNGQPLGAPDEFKMVTIVRQLSPGIRVRTLATVRAGSGFDRSNLSEGKARKIWQIVLKLHEGRQQS